MNFQSWLFIRNVVIVWAKKWNNFAYDPNLMGQIIYYSLEPNSVTVVSKWLNDLQLASRMAHNISKDT